jgi:hypothetical protein
MSCTQFRHYQQCIKQNSMEVCDIVLVVAVVVITDARYWFAFKTQLSAALLLQPENFENLNKSFPERHLEATAAPFTDFQIQNWTQN